MRIAIYLRVSTDDQAESGAGLEAQRIACLALAERSNWEVLGVFPDEGISGAAPVDRCPGLVMAIGSIGAGDALVVAKRDRLGRDIVRVAMIEAEVRRRGGTVISAAGEGSGDDEDPSNILMRNLIDAFSAYERLVIRARTRAALSAKKRRGERTGSVPFGKALADDGRRSKSGLPNGLVDCPGDLEILAAVRSLKDGGLTTRAIAAELTKRGVPTKKGRPAWSHSSVYRLLREGIPDAPPPQGPPAGDERPPDLRTA